MPPTIQKPPSPYRNLVQIHIQSWMFTYIHTYRHNNMKRKQIVIAYIQICCIYENKHIHTYIHTQMILVSLLCIQASMLSYPILLRWVNTPIEQQVSLVVSMPIHSTYIHTPTYIHEMAAADTVDTANLTRISQRVHDHIHIFKWCM